MPQTGVCDEAAVPFDVVVLEVLEKAPAPADHLEQAAAAVVILLVGVEVAPEVIDARREERDLDRRAAAVPFMQLVLLDDVVFDDRHGRFSEAVTFVGQTTLLQSAWRVASARQLAVSVDFLPPVGSRHADRRALAGQLRELVARRLQP